jgi:FtsP/CotA-like multicopper oxidase with cupredoxin domain
MATSSDHHASGGPPLLNGPFSGPPEAPLEFSDMPHEGSPETPGRVTPDIAFVCKVFNDDLTLPDGRRVEYWGFEDERDRRGFPAPTIRVREGQIVHTTLESSKNAHTIHHHGIETDDANDGVGHTSFEVNGHYTYQWRASQAGTYIYHCHVNTTLHFEMGMWGAIIVDPPEGPGRAFRDGPRYDVEATWAAGGIDPEKHELNHAAGLDGEDDGLNLWKPRYFHITGAFHPDSLTSPRAAVITAPGATILARVINGGYFPQRWTFGGLQAEVIASDGRPFGTFATDDPPFDISSPQSFRTGELLVGSAERYDCLLRPTVPGRYVVRVEHLDWITGEVVGIAETTVTVSGAPQPASEPEPAADTPTAPPVAPTAHPAGHDAGARPPGATRRAVPKRRMRLPWRTKQRLRRRRKR